MRKGASCYSVKFVFSVSWQFTEQNRIGLTVFSINLICFFQLPSAEAELEQKGKAFTGLSQCPVSELHWIRCWQLRIAAEMLQVESAGAVKAVYTEQTLLCKFTPEWVLYTHSLWSNSIKQSCPWVTAGTYTLLCPVLAMVILFAAHQSLSAGQYPGRTLKTQQVTVCPQVGTSGTSPWHRVRAQLCNRSRFPQLLWQVLAQELMCGACTRQHEVSSPA